MCGDQNQNVPRRREHRAEVFRRWLIEVGFAEFIQNSIRRGMNLLKQFQVFLLRAKVRGVIVAGGRFAMLFGKSRRQFHAPISVDKSE